MFISFCLIGRRDSSGVRFYYTSHLREYDAGIMSVGERITKLAIIPPKQESWLGVGYCPKECYQVDFLKCLLETFLFISMQYRVEKGNEKLTQCLGTCVINVYPHLIQSTFFSQEYLEASKLPEKGIKVFAVLLHTHLQGESPCFVCRFL